MPLFKSLKSRLAARLLTAPVRRGSRRRNRNRSPIAASLESLERRTLMTFAPSLPTTPSGEPEVHQPVSDPTASDARNETDSHACDPRFYCPGGSHDPTDFDGPQSGRVVYGDFDNDKRLDFVESSPTQVQVIYDVFGDAPRTRSVFELNERDWEPALVRADFNGDGFDDLAIGNDTATVNGKGAAGAVIVHHGSSAGLLEAEVWTQNLWYVPGEAEQFDRFGAALESGDFNNDGYDDLAIGIPDDTVSYEDTSNIKHEVRKAGTVLVLYGTPAKLGRVERYGLPLIFLQTWSQESRDVHDEAETDTLDGPGDGFGSPLTVGDFNGDGYDDLGIGAPGEDDWEFWYIDAATNDEGAAHILYGGSNRLSSKGNQKWTQDTDGIRGSAGDDEFFGRALVSGDFNGDGYSDFVAGVDELDGQGSVHVIYGSAKGAQAKDNQYFTLPGAQGVGGIMLTGDFDNDGRDELVMGMPWSDKTSEGLLDVGRVAVFSATGSAGQLDSYTDWTRRSFGEKLRPKDYFGSVLTSVDVNADGYLDLQIAAGWGEDREWFTLFGSKDGFRLDGGPTWLNQEFQPFDRAVEPTPFSEPPELFAPGEVTGDRTPTIRWKPVEGAVRYELNLFNNGRAVYLNRAVEGTSFTTDELPYSDPDTVYTVHVRAIDADGNAGPFNPAYTFRIEGIATAQDEQRAPATVYDPAVRVQGLRVEQHNEVDQDQETLLWSTVDGATAYDVLIYDLSAGSEAFSRRVHSTSVDIGSLPGGREYQVFVRAVGVPGAPADATFVRKPEYIAGAWSEPLVFWSVRGFTYGVPATPTQTVEEPTPGDSARIEWKEVLDAQTYEMLMYDVAAGRQLVNQTDLTGTSFTPDVTLAAGREYQVFLRGVNARGEVGSWGVLNFQATGNIEKSEPTKLQEPGPLTTNDKPELTWTAGTGDQRFELHVYNVDNGRAVVVENDLTGTSYSFNAPLAAGHYSVYLRGFDNTDATGEWSRIDLTVVTASTNDYADLLSLSDYKPNGLLDGLHRLRQLS